MPDERRGTWKFVAIPTLVVLLLAVYPQLNMWLVKGSAWQGAYVVSNYDEVAYSAYVNALIDGRPRRSDPFTGRDDVEAESLYSIQVVPAYAISLPSRIFGISASTAFIVLNFLIAIFSSLAIFAFLYRVTDDRLLSAVGVLAILCLGTAAAFQGELQHMILGNYLCDFFPFLRRYQPGFAFPIFFVFCIAVWKMFTSDDRKRGIVFAIASGVLLAILVFSYFYLWTAALAWFGCLSLLWLASERRAETGIKIAVVAALGLAAIVPYFILLSNRPSNMDDTQLLAYTRMPDLLVLPEIIGFAIVAAIFFMVRKGKAKMGDPVTLVTLSLALTPFVLFNQQVITGRSLQPVHYEIFIANYMIMAALMLLIFLVNKAYGGGKKARSALVYLGIFAALWGVVESTATARRNAAYESLRDDAMPVLTYLKQQEAADADRGKKYAAVISTNLMVADFIPTVTSYRALWNPHTNSAGGVNLAENKELFYRYLYFSGFDETDVARAMDENLFELMAAFFGGGRALALLEKGAKPISPAEMKREIDEYSRFRAQFDLPKATTPELRYMIVPTAAEPDFTEIDRWYTRDAGTTFDLFRIYKLDLKNIDR